MSNTVGEVLPKRDPQLSAGFLEAGEGIPAAASRIAAGPTADLVFLDVIADIRLTAVGVKRDIGVVQNQQEFGLIAMDSLEGLVEGLKARSLGKDRIEAGLEFLFVFRLGVRFVGLEFGIERPDLITDRRNILSVGLIEGNPLVDEALGMDPAQAMEQDIELPGVITDDGKFW